MPAMLPETPDMPFLLYNAWKRVIFPNFPDFISSDKSLLSPLHTKVPRYSLSNLFLIFHPSNSTASYY